MELFIVLDIIQNPVYYQKLRHLGIFMSYVDILSHIVAYLEPCVTLACSEPWHIQIPATFRTQDIFGTLSRHFLVYSEHCLMLI